jgi:probable rRNA maturation factor
MIALAKSALDIGVVIDGEWPSDAETIVRRAIARAAQMTDADVADHTLAVLLTGDAAIRKLNAQWRGLDKATNVLSFPAPRSKARGARAPLGDIAIARETTAREAADEGKPFGDHLAHLAVHGFLHLLGYDHESDAQAETMEQLERAVLASLGVPDPYPAHASASARA